MCRILKSYDYEDNVSYDFFSTHQRQKGNFSCTISEKEQMDDWSF